MEVTNARAASFRAGPICPDREIGFLPRVQVRECIGAGFVEQSERQSESLLGDMAGQRLAECGVGLREA